MNAYINAISFYLPKKIVTNKELLEDFPEWSVEKVSSKIGVNKRHIAEPNETAGDMAISVGEKLFEEYSHLNKEHIDFVILCTQSPDYILPTTACIVQSKLGLNTACGAIDFNLGCSGYIYGLAIAKGLIVSGIAKNILFITSETYNKHIHPKDKTNRTIFGDAATATLISNNGFAEICDFSLGTDGTGAENLIIKSGGARCTNKINDLHYDENGNIISSDYLFMNGSEIFNFTLEAVPKLVTDTINKNKISKSDINLYIFHQANKYMMNFLRKKIKIEEDKFYYCLENFGNTVSSTIPIALYEAKKENLLNGIVLLAGFGVGYSWGGTILKIN